MWSLHTFLVLTGGEWSKAFLLVERTGIETPKPGGSSLKEPAVIPRGRPSRAGTTVPKGIHDREGNAGTMSSGETISGQYESRFNFSSMLDLIAGPVVIGVVLGLFSPFVEETITFVAGVTNGLATGVIAGIVMLFVLSVSKL